MGLNDPLIIVCEPGHKTGLPYYISRGNETFYDEERYMRRWKTGEEAREWAILNLNEDPYDHLPEHIRAKHPVKVTRDYDDLPLFGAAAGKEDE